MRKYKTVFDSSKNKELQLKQPLELARAGLVRYSLTI